MVCQHHHIKESVVIYPPSHAQLELLLKTFEPMANGFRMWLSDLKVARSVKLLASGTPFHGQSEVWRSTGEAKARVARDKAIKARANMALQYRRPWTTENGTGKPGFIY